MTVYRYVFAGTPIESDTPIVALARLPNVPKTSAATIRVAFYETRQATGTAIQTTTSSESSLSKELVEINEQSVLWRFADTLTFYFDRRASELIASFEAESNRFTVEELLVKTVLPMCVMLQGRLCLHASAVVRDGHVRVFCGPSGAGKSTAAYHCVDRGYHVLADDVVILEQIEQAGSWGVYPSSTSVRLDLTDGAGSKQEIELMRVDSIGSLREVTLDEIFLLGCAGPLSPTEIFDCLLRQLFIGPALIPSEMPRIFAELTTLVRTVPIRCLTDFFSFDTFCDKSSS